MLEPGSNMNGRDGINQIFTLPMIRTSIGKQKSHATFTSDTAFKKRIGRAL